MIPVFEPSISLSDKITVLKSLNKKNISGNSPTVKEFESKFSKHFSRNYGIALSNGSAALDVALNCLNLKQDDEVILPSFTIISCLSAVIRSGAKPVFCDVNENSWNMQVSDVERCITDKTKVIIMVHTYGLPSDAIKLRELCDKKEIILIEDTAEAHGINIEGKLAGTFGDISTFSFYANKHVTTGEGGIILTDNEKINDKVRKIINLDFGSTENRFNHNNLYWNYRLSGLQAALGISQLKNLKYTIETKIKQGEKYQELLSDYKEELQLPLRELNNEKNHYWVFGVVLRKAERSKIMEALRMDGIQTREFFWPLHLQNALPKDFQKKDINLSVSENLGKNGFYLPLGAHINNKKQEFIVNKLLNHLN